MTESAVSPSESPAARVASRLIKLFPLVSLDQNQGLDPYSAAQGRRFRRGSDARFSSVPSAVDCDQRKALGRVYHSNNYPSI